MARLSIVVAQFLLGLIALDKAQPVGTAQGELVHAQVLVQKWYMNRDVQTER